MITPHPVPYLIGPNYPSVQLMIQLSKLASQSEIAHPTSQIANPSGHALWSMR